MHDVRALNELVAKESAFVDDLTAEVGKVIVGQTLHDRAHPHRPADRRARAARGRARPRQDAHRAHALRRDQREVRAHPVHARPAARPTSSAPSSTTSRRASSPRKLGPIFANLVLADEINRAPAKVQSALLEAMQERQVTIGDTDVPAARSVRRHGDAEPDRAGGHLPAARSAGRSLHAHGARSATRAATRSARSWTA